MKDAMGLIALVVRGALSIEGLGAYVLLVLEYLLARAKKLGKNQRYFELQRIVLYNV